MTIRRIFSWVIWLPIAVFIILFVVANRSWVILSLDPSADPTPGLAITLPIWAVFFLGLLLGLILGGLISWFRHATYRQRARRAEVEAERLRGELASQNQRATQSAEKPEQPETPFPMLGNF